MVMFTSGDIIKPKQKPDNTDKYIRTLYISFNLQSNNDCVE